MVQRSDGAVISAGTCWWTFDMGEAMDATEDTYRPPLTLLVPVEVARSYILKLMQADLEVLEGLLQEALD